MNAEILISPDRHKLMAPQICGNWKTISPSGGNEEEGGAKEKSITNSIIQATKTCFEDEK